MREFPAHVPLLATLRGGRIECVHHGSIAVCDRHGTLLAAAGDAQGVNFARSTLKPFQALPFLQDDGPAHLGFGSQEVALMCASHSGEAAHVRVVQRMLARTGAREDDLQCGAHPPRYYAATGEPVPPGRRFGPIFHNCSGKHAGFLAACRLHGQPFAHYLAPDNSLQRRIRELVLPMSGGTLAAAIDGCSAPTYAMPLASLAHAYARLATTDEGAWAAVRFAMLRHPDLVSGTARRDLALAQAGSGDWIAKAGADGVQAIGVCSRGLGIAIRIADGNARALHAVTVEVLVQTGLLKAPAAGPLANAFRTNMVNARGLKTGKLEPLFDLGRLQ